MLAALAPPFIGEPGNRCRRFRDHADRAIAHRYLRRSPRRPGPHSCAASIAACPAACSAIIGATARALASQAPAAAERSRTSCFLSSHPLSPLRGTSPAYAREDANPSSFRLRGRWRAAPDGVAQRLTAPAPAARACRCSTSSLTAQTSASRRSGLCPASPIRVHNSSSSSGNAPTCRHPALLVEGRHRLRPCAFAAPAHGPHGRPPSRPPRAAPPPPWRRPG